MKSNFLFILLLFLPYFAWAQCSVQVNVTPKENYCGNPFSPTAVVDAGVYDVAFEDNFNGRRLSNGWKANPGVSFDNPCGKTADGTPHLWFGIDAREDERFVETNAFDVSRGGKVCFDLRMAEENGTNAADPGCEGPDKPNEGVFVQYSINNGNTWVTINYFNPTPHPVASLVNWNNYCFPLPYEALTTSTRFRWYQAETSGSNVDHWGIDNVQIYTNDADYDFSWKHTTDTRFRPGEHTPGSSTFTYTGTYTNNVTGDECSSSFNVKYRMPKVEASADPMVICNDKNVQLNVNYTFEIDDYCGINPAGCLGVLAERKIGVASGTTEDVFAGGSSRSKRAQWILLANEIGTQPGQIRGFWLENRTLAPADYFGLKVKVRCTTSNEFTNSRFIQGGDLVADIPMLSLKQGMVYIPFDECYNWDGTSNLAISMCYENPVSTIDHEISTTAAGGERLVFTYNSNTGVDRCNENGGDTENFIPVTVLNISSPNPNSNLSYSWTPTNLVTNPSAQSPQGKPGTGSSVTYDVGVVDTNFDICRGNDDVRVTKKTINPGTNGTLTTCRVDGNVNLFEYLGGTPSSGGTWTDPSGNVGSGVINTASAEPGTYTYTISDPDCGAVSARVTVIFQDASAIGTPIEKVVCEESGFVDLFTLLSGNNDKTGVWSDPKNYEALTGNTVNVNALAPGHFNFIYTLPPTATCPEQKVTVTLTIVAKPNPGTPVEVTVCNNTQQVNLMSTLTNSPQSGGTWTNISGQGTLNGSLWDKQTVGPGSYNFRYTVQGSSNCPSESVVTQVNVIDLPTAGENGTTEICNSTPSVRLINYLTGNPDEGGKWIDANATGKLAADGTLSTGTMSAGTYRFVYKIDVTGCPKSEAQVFVTIQDQPIISGGRDTSICGTNQLNLYDLLDDYTEGGSWIDDSGTGDLRADGVLQPSPNLQGTFDFTYTVDAVAPCVAVSETVTVNVSRAVSAGLNNARSVCVGNTVNLTDLLSANASAGGNWQNVSGVSGFNTSTGVLNTSVSGEGDFNFKYVVQANGACPGDESEFRIKVVGAPSIKDINYTCINRNKEYQVSFEIFGGDTNSYSVTPTGSLSLSPTPSFTSNPIASKASQTFLITDGNACATATVNALHDCGCVTSAGTLNADTLFACESEPIQVVHNQDSINDGNDTLIYIIHSGTGGFIGAPLLQSGDGSFTFQPPLQYNTYYSTAAYIVSKGNFNGIDAGDTCLEYTNSVPLIFHPEPEISISTNSPICQGDSFLLQLNLTKGNTPASVDYSYGGSTFSTIINSANAQQWITATQSGNLEITSVQAGACDANPSLTEAITVEDTLRVTNFQFQCNVDNNAYSIVFNVAGGNVSNYAVTGINGQFIGGQFVSDYYPNGTSYDFTLSDGSVCPEKQFSGMYGCPCVTDAGDLDGGVLRICGDDTARVQHNGGQFTDGNDRFFFALHENLNAPFSIIATSNQPKFVFQPGMNLGQEYFISAMAGDSLAGNGINFSDSCFSQSTIVSVTFYDKPTAFTDVDTSLCQFQPLPIPLEITGVGPFDLTVVKNSIPTVYNDVEKGDTLIEYPAAGAFMLSLVSIVDQTNGCFNTASGDAVADVTPAPTATMKGDSVFCVGGAVTVPIDVLFSGERPFFAYLYQDGVLVDSVQTNSTVKRMNVEPGSGENKYALGEIYDDSEAGCVGRSLDTITVTVIPNPVLTISGLDTACVGDTAWFNYQISGMYPGYEGGFEVEFQRAEDGANFEMQLADLTGEIGLPVLEGDNSISTLFVREVRANCLGTTSGAVNLFGLAAPSASLVGDTVLCDEGTNAISLHFSSTGYQGNVLYYSSDNGFVDSLVHAGLGAETVTVNVPIGATTFTLDSLKGNNAYGCAGAVSGTADIRVKELPSASFSFSGSLDTTICSGDSVAIDFLADGDTSPFWLYYTQSNKGSLDSVEVVESASQYITAIPGTITLALAEVRDGANPVCVSALNQELTLTGRIPAEFNFDIIEDTVCVGSNYRVEFTTDGVLPVEVFYSINGEEDTLSMEQPNAGFVVAAPSAYSIITVNQVEDSNPVQCAVQINDVQDSLFGKSLPSLDSVRFTPNPICFMERVGYSVFTSVTEQLSCQALFRGNEWEHLVLNNQLVNSFVADSSVSVVVDSVWYTNGLACGVNELHSDRLVVNPLPEATLAQDTFRVCAGNSVFVLPGITQGEYPISGVFISPGGEQIGWEVRDEADVVTLDPQIEGDWVYMPYSLVDNNGCVGNGSESFHVQIVPNPVVDFYSTVDSACYPLETQLVNTTDSVYDIVSCLWKINDDVHYAFCADSVYLRIDEPGSYSVTLSVQSSDGCMASLTKFNYLQVFEVPIADFTFSPNPPTVRENIVQFIDRSMYGQFYNWQIDTLLESNKRNPVVEFPIIPGAEFDIRYIVSSTGGCADTAFSTLTLQNETFVYVPNAFTPDGNGINDVFLPVPYNVDENYYIVEVYNRWGQVIFRTESTVEGWDGTYNGEKVQHGVYPYRVIYREKDGVYTDELRGHVSVVK